MFADHIILISLGQFQGGKAQCGYPYMKHQPKVQNYGWSQPGFAEELWDGTSGLSSFSEKTRKSNHLQMSLQRKHFLLSYLKTLSVGPAGAWTRTVVRHSTNWANRSAMMKANRRQVSVNVCPIRNKISGPRNSREGLTIINLFCRTCLSFHKTLLSNILRIE